MSNKPTCAVISTWCIECGIAGFAHKMVPALEEHFEVKVFALNQSIIKPVEKKIVKLGDKHIREICDEIKDFDFVNIQFEPGIFGSSPKIIFRRINLILKASKKFYMTFHTVRQDAGFRKRTFARNLLSKKPIKALDYLNDTALTNNYGKMYRKFNSKSFTKGFCLYHTRSAQKFVNLRYPDIPTMDYPLVFISDDSKKNYKASQEKDSKWLKKKYNIPADKIIVSCFGFISKYKNFETVIEAIYRLPDKYHLMIFGATHPNEVTIGNSFNAYLTDLIDLIERKSLEIPQTLTEILQSDRNLTIDVGGILANAKPYSEGKSKVTFGGSLNDDDFERAINGSEINVFSYLEVGQTSSGPIALSLDLSKKTIATYNKCFGQLAKYAPNAYTQYDIGNYQQLASYIENLTNSEQHTEALETYQDDFNVEDRAEKIYKKYLELA